MNRLIGMSIADSVIRHKPVTKVTAIAVSGLDDERLAAVTPHRDDVRSTLLRQGLTARALKLPPSIYDYRVESLARRYHEDVSLLTGCAMLDLVRALSVVHLVPTHVVDPDHRYLTRMLLRHRTSGPAGFELVGADRAGEVLPKARISIRPLSASAVVVLESSETAGLSRQAELMSDLTERLGRAGCRTGQPIGLDGMQPSGFLELVSVGVPREISAA